MQYCPAPAKRVALSCIYKYQGWQVWYLPNYAFTWQRHILESPKEWITNGVQDRFPGPFLLPRVLISLVPWWDART